MVEEPSKGFFEELQALDESTKRRVLLIASAVIMAVVIYLWTGYFESSITTIPLQVSQNQSSTPAESNGNIFDNTRSGMAYLYEEMMAGFRNLSNILQSPRQYIVKPQ